MARAEWRALIADDEPLARRGVRQLLAAFPEFEVVGESRNGAEVLAALDTLRPDVLFLDVQMPGIGGFEVVRRRTPEHMPALVFLTAWEHFALEAWGAQALDYLVKPVSAERFAVAVRRLTSHLRGRGVARPLGEPTLALSTAQGTRLVPLSEVEWIEASDNYVCVRTDARSYLLREALNDVASRVGTLGFVRVHRGALVRLAAIREVLRGRDGALVVVLSSGVRVPVSRRRRASLNAALRGRRP